MTSTVNIELRFRGALDDLSADDRAALFDRTTSSDANIRTQTASIIRDVRARGDAALAAFARQFDGVADLEIEVPRWHCREALDRTPTNLRKAMERAVRNIESVARASLPTSSECEPEPGVVVERRPQPLARVGVYAPGGRAAYPSSVLMGAVPARVAGVAEVVVCSPPQSKGLPSDAVLAAAALAEVDRVFAVGGAGAIAAMAYGTETIPRVDRIVGPGNAYVAEAKLQVIGAVGIEAPAGPSELLIIVDETGDPTSVALEMLAQAEHDPRACVVAITIGETTERDVMHALTRESRNAGSVALEALRNAGAVLVTESLDAAISFANAYAAEHVSIVVGDRCAASRLRNAGTIFVGGRTSVSFGDYMTGANHVLPTGGSARSYSGLSVSDFVRWTTYQRVTASAAARLASDVAVFAEAEGLSGHALAARRAGGLL